MKARKGFTLVELLVVIGIISLLISMLLPALNRARQAAKSIQCESQLRQLGMVLSMYANDNQGLLPPVYWVWWIEIAPYFHVAPGEYFGINFMRCPARPAISEEPTNLFGNTYGVNYGPERGGAFWYTVNRRLVKIPPSVYLAGDGGTYRGVIMCPAVWYFNVDNDKDGVLDSCNYATNGQWYNGATPAVHYGGANYLFADMHVERVLKMDWIRDRNELWGNQGAY